MLDTENTDKNVRTNEPQPATETIPEARRAAESEITDTAPVGPPLPFLDDLLAGLPEGYTYSQMRRTIFVDFGPDVLPVCGPIHVCRDVRARENGVWYVELEFADQGGGAHRLVTPRRDLYLSPARLASRMIDLGLAVYGEAAGITAMLRNWNRCRPYALGTFRAGWFEPPGELPAFVLADGRVISVMPHEPPIAFIPPATCSYVPNGKAGTLDGWRTAIAAPAEGNPMLAFVLMAALSGPLLRFAHIDVLGLNFSGPSSTGKTLLHRLALSVGGGMTAPRRWSDIAEVGGMLQTTCNEQTIGCEAFPSEPSTKELDLSHRFGVGGCVAGASSDDPCGAPHRYVLLSSSEQVLDEIYRHRHRRVPAESAVRMLDIPLPDGGIFDDLHGHLSGRDFTETLNSAIEAHRGHALELFISYLLAKDGLIIKEFAHFMNVALAAILKRVDLSELDLRSRSELEQVFRCFAVVGVAGKIANAMRLLPWAKDYPIEVTSEMAAQWFARHGDRAAGTRDDPGRRLVAFLRTHVAEIVDLTPGVPGEFLTPTQIGWRDERCLYIHSEVFRDQVAPPQSAAVFARDLAEAGLLRPGQSEQRLLQQKMPETKVQGRPRVYVIDRARVEVLMG